MDTKEIKQLIENGLPGATVLMDGDGVHFQAIIIDAVFDGLSPLKRHQAVYKVLGDKMGREIHALSMRVYTPAEWERNRSDSVT